MALDFEPIAGPAGLSRQRDYLERLSRCGQITSDYSFVNIWGWAGEHKLSWAWEEDLVWIRQDGPIPCYWAPVGTWEDIDWHARLPKTFPGGARFLRVPEKLADSMVSAFGGRLERKASRGHWDYLYQMADLIELKGNRFHKKKNLVNQFKRNYKFQLVPLGPDFAKEALALQDDWCLWRDCESIEALAAENRVIKKVFANWNALDQLLGAGIVVDNRLVAYAVGEPLGQDVILIHFEKGNTDYKGVYQAINQIFLESVQGRYRVVNREQDLDDPGLRKAKESYQPSGFHKKYELLFP